MNMLLLGHPRGARSLLNGEECLCSQMLNSAKLVFTSRGQCEGESKEASRREFELDQGRAFGMTIPAQRRPPPTGTWV